MKRHRTLLTPANPLLYAVILAAGLCGCIKLPQYQPALSAGAPPSANTQAQPPRPAPPAPPTLPPPPAPPEPVTQEDSPRREVTPSTPNSAPPTPPTAPTPRHALADCYAFIACASADNRTGRYSPPMYVQEGLAKIVDKEVLPLHQKGWRRFYVDSPFGKDTDEKGHAKFTFFGSIRTSGDSPWQRGFVESWKRITQKPGVKVIAYLGNPYADAEYKHMAAGPGSRERCKSMLRSALKPILDAGFTGIAIDAASDLPEDTALAEVLKDLHDSGKDIFIEATPKADQRWLTRFGTIRTTWFARGAPTFKGLVNVKDCQGERIQLFDGTPPYDWAKTRTFDSWARKWVNDCFENGERPAFGPYSIKDPRLIGLD